MAQEYADMLKTEPQGHCGKLSDQDSLAEYRQGRALLLHMWELCLFPSWSNHQNRQADWVTDIVSYMQSKDKYKNREAEEVISKTEFQQDFLNCFAMELSLIHI